MNTKIDSAIKEGLRLKDLDMKKYNSKLIKDVPRVIKWADKHLYKLIAKAVRDGKKYVSLGNQLCWKFSFISIESMLYGLETIPGITVTISHGYSVTHYLLRWEL